MATVQIVNSSRRWSVSSVCSHQAKRRDELAPIRKQEAMSFNWADYGSDNSDLEKSTRDAKERRSSQNARKRQKRLWLPVNAEKMVVVLDDDPFRIDEHSMLINGTRKGNWFTCIKKLAALAEDKPELKMFKGGCPFCSINEPYFVGFITVMVVTPFRIERGPDRGKEIKNYRNLLPMKLETLEWFQKEKRDRKTLIGALYRFSRTKKQGQASFGVPSFLKEVDLNSPKLLMQSRDANGNDVQIPPVAWTKEEYSKMFEPLSHSEMASLAKEIRAGSDGSKKSRDRDDDDDDYRNVGGGDDIDGSGSSDGGDDEIPF